METGVENVVTTTTTGTIPADLIANGSITIPAEKVAEKLQEPAKNFDVDKLKAEIDKLKASLSKANSEAAEYKRQRNEQMDKSKLAEVERAEQEKAMREELETLRKEKAVTDYTNKALEVGFDTETAAQAANAMADGDMNAVFDALKAFVEATKTRLNNEALNRQPGLSTGVPPTKNTTDDSDMNQMRRWMGAPLHR